MPREWNKIYFRAIYSKSLAESVVFQTKKKKKKKKKKALKSRTLITKTTLLFDSQFSHKIIYKFSDIYCRNIIIKLLPTPFQLYIRFFLSFPVITIYVHVKSIQPLSKLIFLERKGYVIPHNIKVSKLSKFLAKIP